GGVQKKIIEARKDGLQRVRLLPDIELHGVARDQPWMIQLLKDPQLVTRLHASQEHDRNSALVGRQPRTEAPIGPLAGSLVARGSGLVVVLGKPAVGWQLRRDHASEI